jgi:TonB family protein
MGRKFVCAAALACGLAWSVSAFAQPSNASGTTQQDDLAAASSAYHQGHYEQLLNIVQPRAAQGDAGARTVLGMIYLEGKALPRDEVKAAALFGQGAVAGSPNAVMELGKLYFDGSVEGMHNPVLGYALLKASLVTMYDQSERHIAESILHSKRLSMSFGQITQARVLADEIQRNGLLPAMRDYLGDISADHVFCRAPVGPNSCDEASKGIRPLRLMVDKQGVIHQGSNEMPPANLETLFITSSALFPQPQVIVTVEGQSSAANEAVGMVLAKAQDAGIALVSVVPDGRQEDVSQMGDHHLSVILGEVAAAPDGMDVALVPTFVVPKFRPDRQPVLVWLDEQGKVTATRPDRRYNAAPDMDAVKWAARLTYDPCLKGDAGTPCMMEALVPVSVPLKPDGKPASEHQLNIVPVTLLTQTPPVYPPEAIKNLHRGTVQLSVHVSAQGLPLDITFSPSSGYRELDDAAENAASHWTFKPQTVEGVPTDSYIKIPVNFGLNQPVVQQSAGTPSVPGATLK